MEKQTKKFIAIIFEDGEEWRIPLEFIAKNRADYYQTKKEDDFNYQGEVDFIMNDDYEGIDWLQNNMDKSDFEGVLIIIPNKDKPERDFCNAESNIIEIEEEVRNSSHA